jgi:serine/threonine protein kinase
MGATAVVHPTDQVLQSYGLGKLDDVSSVSVSKHLEECDSCQRRVAELSSDDFVGRLQKAQAKRDESATSWSPSAPSSTEGTPGPVAPPPADTLPPELVDHLDYEIVRELGRGGMGVVYLAQNKLMGRPEVLKVVGRHLVERPGVGDRFLREIRSAAKLHHPNIVTAHSAIRLGESLVLAMEYVEGLDLAKMVKTKGPLPIAHACYFVHQAALGLQHAHERGMVHRDIKPANLILARDGKKAIVKVLDFGLAKVTSEGQTDSGLTREGQMLGTPDYIAPEQIRNAQSADIRADIYSLGCTFYYLLTGGPPFRGDHLWDVYQAHFSMEAGPLNLVRPEVPVELAAVVAKMMAKEPGRRFQTPKDVAQALTPFFKRINASAQISSAEVSHVGQQTAQPARVEIPSVATQPATNVVPAVAPPVKKSSQPDWAEPKWESLIEFKETEPLTEPAPRVVAKPKVGKPTWFWLATVAGLLLLGFLVVWAVVVLVVRTPNGNLVLENVPEKAVVEVDGEKKVIVTPAAGKPIEIQLKPGTHSVVVKRDGVVLTGETLTIESGKDFKLDVRREAEVGSRSATSESKISSKQTDEANPPIIDRTRFAVHAGNWSLDGDDLVQTDVTRWYNATLFGDDRWTDYDFTVDAMRVGGANSFSLFFRSMDKDDGFEFAVSGEGNTTCHIATHQNLHSQKLKSFDFTLQDHKWYNARVQVRGNRLEGFITNLSAGGREIKVFDIDDGRHSRGRVGLGTFLSSFRFKNIKVTSPDGKVLWEGPPAVDLITPSEFSKLTDQVKPSVEAQDGFVQLFNGIDLTGWKTHSQQPGNWRVENGNLVGSGPSAVSHLYTIGDDYKDFHLRAEARINDAGNSGVYFRASFGPTWPVDDLRFPIGYEAQIYSKPGGQTYTGSLYAGVEPVVKVNVRPALPFEWCTLEVIARSNHIVVKVNGITTADYTDVKRLYSQGHIALQHNSPQTIVEFRKIEIKELAPTLPAAAPRTQEVSTTDVRPDASGADRGFVPLFNGKDLTGWTAFSKSQKVDPQAVAHVFEGEIRMIPRDESGLRIGRSYKNFALTVEFMFPIGGKLTKPGSGIIILPDSGDGLSYQRGIECQVRPGESGDFFSLAGASLVGEERRNSAGKVARKLDAERPPGRWNKVVIRCEGFCITYELNGREVNRADSDQPISGWIGIMNQGTDVRFRNIKIKALAPSSSAADLEPERVTAKSEPARGTLDSGGSDGKKNSIARKALKNKDVDALQPGTIWTGKHHLSVDGATKPLVSPVTFIVHERNGEKFAARYVLPNDIREIVGTISNGQVRWLARDVTVVKGNQGLDNFGTIRGGQITVSFSGILPGTGQKMSGTVELRLDK